jgi:D-serine deaminase-like pyridoxal phosphate-dependent protein
VQASDLGHLARANRRARCAVVVDDAAQVEAIAAAARAQAVRVPLVVEQDVSWRPLGGALHVGVRRSPLHGEAEVVALARRIAATDGVDFAGLMAYEAQIAGLTDASPHHAWENGVRRALKRVSRGAVERARAASVRALARAGLAPALVNGGGTGSVGWAAAEPALTELTVGSGFLGAHLFDGYADLALAPAAYFALQVVRRPAPGLVTCHGGGYVASGDGGRDRLPAPSLPEGARLLRMEGAGEVQTPVALPPGVDVAPGDPIFFRHAKAGELAEHFDRYLLVRGDAVVESAPTYRGLGRCFLG